MVMNLEQVLTAKEPKGALEAILHKLAEGNDLTEALNLWGELKDGLDFYKDWEMRFRKALDEKCFNPNQLGTIHIPLANGYKLKTEHKQNVKVAEELFPVVRAELAAQNLSLDQFLKVKYDLDTKAYGAIVAAEAHLENKPIGTALRKMITTTPSAPSLSIVAPKDTK